MKLLRESLINSYTKRNKTKKDANENDSEAIKIEDEFNMLEEDNSSFAYELPDDIGIGRTTSTIVKPKEFIADLNPNVESQEDNSTYSLGDGDKLYQKLETFIKLLVQNGFKKESRKFPSKNSSNNVVAVKKTRFSIIEDEESNGSWTPKKNQLIEQNSFKMNNLRLPIKHSQTQMQLLTVTKNS